MGGSGERSGGELLVMVLGRCKRDGGSVREREKRLRMRPRVTFWTRREGHVDRK